MSLKYQFIKCSLVCLVKLRAAKPLGSNDYVLFVAVCWILWSISTSFMRGSGRRQIKLFKSPLVSDAFLACETLIFHWLFVYSTRISSPTGHSVQAEMIANAFTKKANKSLQFHFQWMTREFSKAIRWPLWRKGCLLSSSFWKSRKPSLAASSKSAPKNPSVCTKRKDPKWPMRLMDKRIEWIAVFCRRYPCPSNVWRIEVCLRLVGFYWFWRAFFLVSGLWTPFHSLLGWSVYTVRLGGMITGRFSDVSTNGPWIPFCNVDLRLCFSNIEWC